MKLIPSTLDQVAPILPKGRPTVPKMAVYSNGNIRFNKVAARLLNAPVSISIDLETMTIAKDPDGFTLKFYSAFREFTISNSRLGKYILRRFGTKKVYFQIAQDGETFTLNQIGVVPV